MKPKPNSTPKPERAMPAAKWVPIFDAVGIAPPAPGDAKTPRARAIKIGQWLSAKVGRETPVCVGGRSGKAVLRVIGARANEKRYYFEVTWDSVPPPKGVVSKPKKKGKQSEEHKAKDEPAAKHKHKAGDND